MNIIDVFILIVLVVLSIRGYVKGFIHEVFSLMIMILGIALALLFYRQVGFFLETIIQNEDLSLILSFIAIFICTAVLMVVIRNALTSLVESLNITDLDSVFGLLVGLTKGALLLSFLLVFFTHRQILKLEKVTQSSFFYPFLKRFLLAILSVLPDTIYNGITRFLGVV
jgi:membrane protein required for colicin V production